MPRLAFTFKILLISSITFSFILVTYYSSYSNTPTATVKVQKVSNTTKYILFWTGTANFRLQNHKGSAFFERHCKAKNCLITEDRNLLPVDEYAAILFFVPTSSFHPKETLPAKRHPRQRYVFANYESPIRFRGKNAQYVYNNFYNWTMTYRLDSDLVKRHGKVVRKKTEYKMPAKRDILKKIGSVAWIVSNCKSADGRERIAKNLGKHIKVDVFGECGTEKCPSGVDCYDHVAKHYKFYLSFENSHCRDYTTEKFYKVLERDIIPVVYGGGNYSSIAPAHSFINVEDFTSAEALANYLKTLEKDLDSYLKYFEWKKHHKVERKLEAMIVCQLCEMLNDPELPPKVYEDIEYWWYETAKCRAGPQLPPIALEGNEF